MRSEFFQVFDAFNLQRFIQETGDSSYDLLLIIIKRDNFCKNSKLLILIAAMIGTVVFDLLSLFDHRLQKRNHFLVLDLVDIEISQFKICRITEKLFERLIELFDMKMAIKIEHRDRGLFEKSSKFLLLPVNRPFLSTGTLHEFSRRLSDKC